MLVLSAAIGVPAQMRAVATARGFTIPEGARAMIPTIGLVTIALVAATVGTAAAARVGLATPVLRPAGTDGALVVLARHIAAGVLGGLIVVAGILPLYYGIMQRFFEPAAFELVEGVRRGMGLPARIAMGGVIEEVFFRWGALAVIAWIGLKVSGHVDSAVRWSAILGAAVLFGLAHVPGARGLGVRMGPALVLVGLTINGLLGVVAGWMVWHRGLVAAMTVHATVHVVWSAVDSLGAS